MRNRNEDVRAHLTDKMLFKRLASYMKGKKNSFILALVFMGVSVGLALALPRIQGKIIGELGLEDINFTVVLMFLGVYALSLIVSFAIEYRQTMLLQQTGQDIIYNVREEVFTHIESQSIAQINRNPVGKLVTRVTNDTNTLSEMFTSLLVNLIRNVIMIVGIIIIMFWMHVELTLYVLIGVPVVMVVSYFFRLLSRQAFRDVRHNVSNVNAFLSENLSGIKVTQIFNQEEKKIAEFRERNLKLHKSSMRQLLIFGIFRPIIYVLYTLTLTLTLYIGSKNAILGGILTYEIIFTFTLYIERLFNPIQQLAEEFHVLQAAFASSERIFDTLDEMPEIVDEIDAIELKEMKGEIEFKNVWFKYIEDEWVLRDVSFKINAKDTVAFVGATGSGKTTILSLIVRNYDIQKGQILIDGIDIKRIKIASLRRYIGQMLQDVFLFSGDITSNIKMKEDSISDDEMIEAARYVNADRFINQLPNQYHEEVRERGNNFSSGQRQLLSFARTVVHKPAIMILDEATANIDTETEILIQDSLEKMMNIGTMIMVAHRLSTIQHADNIIVMQKGQIIEQGTHQALLKKKGHYYKLYQLQYSDQHPHEINGGNQ